ncbi:hypothetical protein WJ0W_004095 [Paenibacillus melissococcoides]|uniref:Uncharacterized protein n=1 Tax=Paenibacillus melissococcoides TaxID=2912268 RepID=A0ABM9G5K8_9BACL|nr:hypothetical protein [Paenibacillus melissococcoides]CAH8246863.1 hypothetical protein WJ0W_004095 [Paenibacillus melissococcoides]
MTVAWSAPSFFSLSAEKNPTPAAPSAAPHWDEAPATEAAAGSSSGKSISPVDTYALLAEWL